MSDSEQQADLWAEPSPKPRLDLTEAAAAAKAQRAEQTPPLAERMRPRCFEQVVGQTALMSPSGSLRRALAGGGLHSMIFWGPPGTGKTTLARLIAEHGEGDFFQLSAVLDGVKQIRDAVAGAKASLAQGRQAVLFVDEVHRFNKAQQDAFLPHIENGTVYFIGATTENPSFALNNALLSRARVYVLQPLAVADILTVLHRALSDSPQGLGGRDWQIEPAALLAMAKAADGDVRRALNLLELAASLAEPDEQGRWQLADSALSEVLQGRRRRFDRDGDIFYDQVSALHKSMRGSDPDAALYWFCRLLDGGCDPNYLARRILRVATEDVGLADPRALQLALQAWQVYERLGSPEGELALAQAVLYCACAAKSDAGYKALAAARKAVLEAGDLPVPMALRNAPTALMASLGHGQGYRHAHDEPDAFAAGADYLPEPLQAARFYHPVNRGLELKITEKLQRLRQSNAAAKQKR